MVALAYTHRAMASFYLQQYPQAWTDVRKAQQLGGRIDPNFISELTRLSGQGQ